MGGFLARVRGWRSSDFLDSEVFLGLRCCSFLLLGFGGWFWCVVFGGCGDLGLIALLVRNLIGLPRTFEF